LLCASISTRKDVETDAAAQQFVSERDDERSLASAANRNVSDTDNRRTQSLNLENATVIQSVSR
jgi:hypothetical protein